MKNITLKLYAGLGELFPGLPDPYPVDDGATIKELINTIGIPEKKAKLIFVNGKKADFSTMLRNKDRVAIFPPVGGG